MNDNLLINKSLPYVMHIDLNSCFAIIEQQANRLLRGRPVGISAYDTPRGFVLAASYEAKTKGVKLGVNVGQARSMCPGIVIMTPDPAKYREAHKLFKAVLLEYSPDVTPKSIDEFILNLEHSPALKNKKSELRTTKSENIQLSEAERQLHNQAMVQIGKDIKKSIKERLGEWVTVNIGIAPNRFLAKYAAGFDKPDGMTLIDHVNLRSKYKDMKLVDLPGINTRFRKRLREAGVYTPLDFLEADLNTLKKRVFKSIGGYYWYLRLRGHEIDTTESKQKSIGHQYALKDKTTDIDELCRLLMKLSEKTGRRLRKSNQYASGIHLYLGFESNNPILDSPASFEHIYKLNSWHHGEKVYHRLYSTQDIYESAKRLLLSAEIPNRVKIMSVNVFGLESWDPEQLSIFDIQILAKPTLKQSSTVQSSTLYSVNGVVRSMEVKKRVSDAVDEINNRYGEFVVTPALMMEMQGKILDRIAFGQVRDL